MNSCKECKHLIGVRYAVEFALGWKCGYPLNIRTTSTDPVTGNPENTYLYGTCYAARAEGAPCGPHGTWFDPYEAPQRATSRADSLLNELHGASK